MGINFGRFGGIMPQEQLNIPQIHSVFKQMCCKTMPQSMCGNMLFYTRTFTCIDYGIENATALHFSLVCPPIR